MSTGDPSEDPTETEDPTTGEQDAGLDGPFDRISLGSAGYGVLFGALVLLLVDVASPGLIGGPIVPADNTTNGLIVSGVVTLLGVVLIFLAIRLVAATDASNVQLSELIDEITDVVAIVAIAAVAVLSGANQATLAAIVSVALGKRIFKNTGSR